MGNETVQNLTTPWCISKKKINVTKNIINFEKAGEKETIGYNMSMAFNLLIREVPDNECTFKTMDSKVATVDETTGEVTAVGQGTTYVKLYNKKNDLSAAVKGIEEKYGVSAAAVAAPVAGAAGAAAAEEKSEFNVVLKDVGASN